MDTSEHGIKAGSAQEVFAALPKEKKVQIVKEVLDDFTTGLGSNPVENALILDNRIRASMGLPPRKA